MATPEENPSTGLPSLTLPINPTGTNQGVSSYGALRRRNRNGRIEEEPFYPIPPKNLSESRSQETRALMKNRDIADINFSKIKRIYFDGDDSLYYENHPGPSDLHAKSILISDHPLGPGEIEDGEELDQALNELSPLLPLHRRPRQKTWCSFFCGLFCKCTKVCCRIIEPLEGAIGEGLRFRPEDVELIEKLKKNPTHGIPVGTLPFGTHDVMDIGTCESLNYKSSSCEMKFQHDLKNVAAGVLYRKYGIKYFICIVIAGLVGSLGFAINQVIHMFATVKYWLMSNWMEKMFNSSTGFLMMFYIIALNFAIIAFAALMGYLEPVSTGSGIPHIKAYLNGLKVPRLMRMKTLITKALGVVASVVGGLPVVRRDKVYFVSRLTVSFSFLG